MYLDSKGLITQKGGDAGDQLQREGFWYEGLSLNPLYSKIPGMLPYIEALFILHTTKGFTRSWVPPYNDPTDTSRDQLVSNIRALGYFSEHLIVSRIFWDVIRNYSRFPNNDIAFINDYGRFIRAYESWWLYPLLFLFDVPLIVNSIIRIIKSRNLDNVGDDVNHIGDLAQAQNVYPTPISWFARKIYKRFHTNGVQYALDWYFRADSGANPEFAELWAPIVARF